MSAHLEYIVLVRDGFRILRVDEAGAKSLSSATYPRPEAALKALQLQTPHEFAPLDDATAAMLGEPYFYVNTRKTGHIWFGDKFLCGYKPIRSTAVFSHHRPDFLCVDCIRELKERPKLFDAVFDQETAKYRAAPKSAASTSRRTFADEDNAALAGRNIPNGVLLFWVKGLVECSITRRRMWPLFLRKVLDGLAIGSEVGLPQPIVKFLARLRDMEIPFESIRITVLDQFDPDDARYPHADQVWNPLLQTAGLLPFNTPWLEVKLYRQGANVWIPKSKFDRTSIERLSMTLAEWRAFFKRPDRHDNLPCGVDGFEKIDPEAMPSAGMKSSDEDYVLRFDDFLTAVKRDDGYELRLVTESGTYANATRVSSVASAYATLCTIRRKGVVRWAYWHKVEVSEPGGEAGS